MEVGLVIWPSVFVEVASMNVVGVPRLCHRDSLLLTRPLNCPKNEKSPSSFWLALKKNGTTQRLPSSLLHRDSTSIYLLTYKFKCAFPGLTSKYYV